MATRNFKIRTGLEVNGELVVGGKSVSRLLDNDEVTNIINNTVVGMADS